MKRKDRGKVGQTYNHSLRNQAIKRSCNLESRPDDEENLTTQLLEFMATGLPGTSIDQIFHREIARLSRKRAPFKGIFVGGHKGSGIHASKFEEEDRSFHFNLSLAVQSLNYNRVNWNIWLFLLYERRKKFSIRRREGKFARDFRRHAVFEG